jgi:hypothetical protein
MNEKLQKKVNKLGQILLLMKKEQSTIRMAMIKMMGKKKKGGVAAAAVVTCIAQDMKSMLSNDENRSSCVEGDLLEDEN